MAKPSLERDAGASSNKGSARGGNALDLARSFSGSTDVHHLDCCSAVLSFRRHRGRYRIEATPKRQASERRITPAQIDSSRCSNGRRPRHIIRADPPVPGSSSRGTGATTSISVRFPRCGRRPTRTRRRSSSTSRAGVRAEGEGTPGAVGSVTRAKERRRPKARVNEVARARRRENDNRTGCSSGLHFVNARIFHLRSAGYTANKRAFESCTRDAQWLLVGQQGRSTRQAGPVVTPAHRPMRRLSLRIATAWRARRGCADRAADAHGATRHGRRWSLSERLGR